MDYVRVIIWVQQLKLGCNGEYDQNWAWAYFTCWHSFIPWKDNREGVS